MRRDRKLAILLMAEHTSLSERAVTDDEVKELVDEGLLDPQEWYPEKPVTDVVKLSENIPYDEWPRLHGVKGLTPEGIQYISEELNK